MRSTVTGILVGLAAAALLVVSLGGSTRSSWPLDGRIYGPARAMGAGTVRTYVDLDQGRPVALGVALTEAALAGLPELVSGLEPHAVTLPLPAGNPTAYRHVMVDWSPEGREPPGVYDVPRLDLHFFTVPPARRLAIEPKADGFAVRAARYPAPPHVPAGFIASAPVAVPYLGVHWVDPRSPELNGEPLSHTFRYGSWDGQMIFAESMVSRAFLETRPDVSRAIPVAARHAEPGWYASRYRIRWNDEIEQYEIALTGLEYRN